MHHYFISIHFWEVMSIFLQGHRLEHTYLSFVPEEAQSTQQVYDTSTGYDIACASRNMVSMSAFKPENFRLSNCRPLLQGKSSLAWMVLCILPGKPQKTPTTISRGLCCLMHICGMPGVQLARAAEPRSGWSQISLGAVVGVSRGLFFYPSKGLSLAWGTCGKWSAAHAMEGSGGTRSGPQFGGPCFRKTFRCRADTIIAHIVGESSLVRVYIFYHLLGTKNPPSMWAQISCDNQGWLFTPGL